MCKSSAIMCHNKKCECKRDHLTCYLVQLDPILHKIFEKKQNMPP